MLNSCRIAVGIILALGGASFAAETASTAPAKLMPAIDGDWWQVAGDPDVGEYTTAEQQPVDFCIWQADDGTWQVWSCVRKTKYPGKTRLFFGWEG
jgi:hypothetical protein